MVEIMKGTIAGIFARKGWLINGPATEYIAKQKEPKVFIEGLIPLLRIYGSRIIDLGTIHHVLENKEELENDHPDESEEEGEDISSDELECIPPFTLECDNENKPLGFAKNFEPSFKVEPGYSSIESSITIDRDITGKSLCEGEKTDFINLFNSRFSKLKEIIQKDRSPVTSVAQLRSGSRQLYDSNESQKLVGLVADIRSNKEGKVYGFELEDDSGTMICIIPDEQKGPKPIPRDMVHDEVIGVMGRPNRKRDRFYVDGITRPSINWSRKNNLCSEEIYAVFISDIHLGSKTFLENQWMAFVKWLNGGFESGSELVNKIKYIVMGGDVADGIGIYPNQKFDLDIVDIDMQYKMLAKYLDVLPEHISTVIIPGNHDAVRPSEPQPALKEDIRDLFNSRVTFLGNPSMFQLNGVRVLAYHGAAIDDWITIRSELNYTNPIESMKQMLDRRHILPMYGMKTPLAPEKEDYLVIDPEPDIFLTGHTHSFGVDIYRKTLLINGSTWQSQTDYQKRHNFDPVPAKVTVVNLKDLKATVIDFMNCRPEIQNINA